MNYLVANHYQKPNVNLKVRTEKPGWKNIPNSMVINEQCVLTKSLKTKDLTMAAVILDLRKKTVIKDIYKSNQDFDTLYQYFVNSYPQYFPSSEPKIRVLDQESRALDTSTGISSSDYK